MGFSESVEILQATEFTFNNDDFNKFKSVLREEIKKADKNQSKRLNEIFDDLTIAMENDDADGLSILSPLSNDCGNVFEYLGKDTVIIIDESKRVNEIAILNQTEFTERQASLFSGGEVFSFSKNTFCSVEQLTAKIKEYKKLRRHKK